MASSRRIALWGLLGLTAIALGAAVYFSIRAGDEADSLLSNVAGVAAAVSSACVGYLLASRVPRNPLGWILLASGLYFALQGFAEAYARYGILAAPGSVPAADWAVVFVDRAWPGLFVGITAIAYLFPTGRLPSPRWRPIARLTAASFALLLLLTPFSGEAYSQPYEHVAAPLPTLPSGLYTAVLFIGLLGALAGMTGAALSLRSRFKAATGVERQQLRWLVHASLLIPAAILLCLAEGVVTGSDGPVTFAAVVLAVTGIPIAVGVAVARYRLYEFDRIVNRTLVYAILTALLAGTFATVSLLIGVWAGSGSTVPTAVATLAVAAAFGPLRGRIQQTVDRRFNRARYLGLRRVEAYLEELRAGRAAPEEVESVLAEALADPSLVLLYRLESQTALVDASGVGGELPEGPGRTVVPVTRGGLALGEISHDAALNERPDLVASVISAAGLAIEIGRLRAEVSHRLTEVRDSRARIVAAGNAERRRLERDLHDGAQQRLVSIGLSLRHIQQQLPASGGTSEALDATVDELGTAIEELRELARGVRPPALDDGLAPALRQLAARCPLPIDVNATTDRFGEDVETAAYFVASEALANSLKHAGATTVSMLARRENGSLVVSVSDDGSGGAEMRDGSGLAGIDDRLAALGGTLALESPTGAGTTITARLPCA